MEHFKKRLIHKHQRPKEKEEQQKEEEEESKINTKQIKIAKKRAICRSKFRHNNLEIFKLGKSIPTLSYKNIELTSNNNKNMTEQIINTIEGQIQINKLKKTDFNPIENHLQTDINKSKQIDFNPFKIHEKSNFDSHTSNKSIKSESCCIESPRQVIKHNLPPVISTNIKFKKNPSIITEKPINLCVKSNYHSFPQIQQQFYRLSNVNCQPISNVTDIPTTSTKTSELSNVIYPVNNFEKEDKCLIVKDTSMEVTKIYKKEEEKSTIPKDDLNLFKELLKKEDSNIYNKILNKIKLRVKKEDSNLPPQEVIVIDDDEDEKKKKKIPELTDFQQQIRNLTGFNNHIEKEEDKYSYYQYAQSPIYKYNRYKSLDNSLYKNELSLKRRLSLETVSSLESDHSPITEEEIFKIKVDSKWYLVKKSTLESIPQGKLCYLREKNYLIRYYDDIQLIEFLRNINVNYILPTQQKLQTGYLMEDIFISPYKIPDRNQVIQLHNVSFSKEDYLPDPESYVEEIEKVERFVPKDFLRFYRYVTGYQIVNNHHPISFQTFLTMHNTNGIRIFYKKYILSVLENKYVC